MINGIGVDIVEISRIRKSIQRDGFLAKVFSHKEIEYCKKSAKSHENYAGRFAVKEALIKAIGEGLLFKIDLSKIEIVNDEHGKPEIKLSDEVCSLFPYLKESSIHVSISHSASYAVGMVIIEK